MSKKIAAADKSAMDALYQGEVGKRAKQAGLDLSEGTGITDTAVADHDEYMATLGSILDSDDKESFDPNDEIKD